MNLLNFIKAIVIFIIGVLAFMFIYAIPILGAIVNFIVSILFTALSIYLIYENLEKR